MNYQRLLGVLNRRLRQALVDPVQRRRWKRGLSAAYAAVERFPTVVERRGHGLAAPLIVSLTSYPARFPTLPLTVKSLLDQRVAADRTVLWVAHRDRVALTHEILELTSHGLDIQFCHDLRSYKKLVPALSRWPMSFFVTADDDCYYPPNWLETLVERYRAGPPAIVAWQANRPKRLRNGRMAPYRDWSFRVVDRGVCPAPGSIFPVGVGGILYPPGALPVDTLDPELFMSLAPHGDDLWFYWMGRKAGTLYRQAGRPFPQIFWDGTQDQALFSENAAGRNDEQISALERVLGPA